jgi:DNA-binding NarL/FixJ family response regulator
MVITQRTAEAAANQIRAYDADIAGCTDREGAPAGIDVTTPDATTAAQRALVARLGPDAYVYYLEDGSTTSWVLGTRTANAGGYFAFDSDSFTLNQALQATVAARERMAATYGE